MKIVEFNAKIVNLSVLLERLCGMSDSLRDRVTEALQSSEFVWGTNQHSLVGLKRVRHVFRNESETEYEAVRDDILVGSYLPAERVDAVFDFLADENVQFVDLEN